MTEIRDIHARCIDGLSEYLDGSLEAERHAAIEEHLAECGDCRRVLEELRGLVDRAGALGPLEPPRDLWAGIAATIEAPAPVPAPAAGTDSKVIALPTAATVDLDRETARVSFSMPQLAAAVIALVALSSMATWAAGPGLGSGLDGGDPATAVQGVFRTASADEAVPPELADELAALERLLDEARPGLDPNTVRVLERNLAVIERAIEDSRLALRQDPENEFLTEHLERVYESKLTFLREAAEFAEWSD